jgi:DNA-binding transcriptional MerR regulator
MPRTLADDTVMRPGQVALLFHVDVRTVWHWANIGRFPDGAVFKTEGGHRRFWRSDVHALHTTDERTDT